MTATITTSTDITYNRIGVTLGGWAADGAVTVNRVHADGTQWPVRGVSNVSGGSAFAWDYESPLMQAVTYTALNSGTPVTSSPVTLSVDQALLRAPGLPSLDAKIRAVSNPTVTRAAPKNVLRPIGRMTPIALLGQRTAPEFMIDVRTFSDAQAAALVNCVNSANVSLLVLPGMRRNWQYVAIGNIVETPMVRWRPQAAGDPGEYATWTLDCTVVDRPIGGIFGDPTASYQKIKDTYATYTALKAAKAAYLNVLQGV